MRCNGARLSSLLDDAFASASGNGGTSVTLRCEMRNPTDWEIHSAAPAVTTYDVGGYGSTVTDSSNTAAADIGTVADGGRQALRRTAYHSRSATPIVASATWR